MKHARVSRLVPMVSALVLTSAFFVGPAGAEGPNPRFAFDMPWNTLSGWEFAVDTRVDISVLESTEVFSGSTTTDAGGNFWFSFPDAGFTPEPGQEIVVSQDPITKSLFVAPLTATADISLDRVAGTADPNAEVEVSVDIGGGEGDPQPVRLVTATGGGGWEADFATPLDPPQDLIADLDLYSSGWVIQRDDDGDMTELNWRARERWILLKMAADRALIESNGLAQGPATVEVFGSPPADLLATWEAWVDGGNIYFEIWSEEFALLPGQTLVVTDSASNVRSLLVPELSVDRIDDLAAPLAGTCVADVSLVRGEWPFEPPEDVATCIDGRWESSALSPLARGEAGLAYTYDDDGDVAAVVWYVPDPKILVGVAEQEIAGREWPLGSTVTLTVDDPGTSESPDLTLYQPATEFVDSYQPWWTGRGAPGLGSVFFDLAASDVHVVPGDIVTMTDGTTTKVLEVSPLEVVSVDAGSDLVSGVASPDAELIVTPNAEPDWGQRHEFAEPTGSWTADFSVDGDEPDDPWYESPLDITDRMLVAATQSDDDGDQTVSTSPLPAITVASDLDQVWGFDFVGEVTLEIDDPLTLGTEFTDTQTAGCSFWRGRHWFDPSTAPACGPVPWPLAARPFAVVFDLPFDVDGGEVVTLTDLLGHTETHVVLALSITGATPEAIWGTAEGEAPISIHEDDGAYWGGGAWSAGGLWSFEGDDIWPAPFTPGSWGQAMRFDERGNRTLVHWKVRFYGFEGFRPPVSSTAVNQAKAGKMIPLEFRVTLEGDPVESLPRLTVTSAPVSPPTAPLTPVIHRYSRGDGGLQYLGNGWYRFDWQTEKNWKNGYYVMTLDLGDGAPHQAYFKFK